MNSLVELARTPAQGQPRTGTDEATHNRSLCITLQSGRQPARSSKYLCSRNQRAGMLKLPYGVGMLAPI